MRVILGGARHPELLNLNDEELLALVHEELSIMLGGAMPKPDFHRIIRWPAGIPQYELGHLDRVARAETALAAHPGLHLAGNGVHGVSVADCVARAHALVELV